VRTNGVNGRQLRCLATIHFRTFGLGSDGASEGVGDLVKDPGRSPGRHSKRRVGRVRSAADDQLIPQGVDHVFPHVVRVAR
jgi:hypothetical protein